MQARKLLLVRAPVKERKMLSRIAMPVVANQAELHRGARIKNVNVRDFNGLEHPVGLVLRYGEDDLNRLVIEPDHVRRVVSTRVPRPFGAVDDRCTMNTKVLRFM